ncbi:MAG UNVERIFIED_CONTAM: hypothetical protein LVR18_13815 [Planctomycetaceae bacterium]
MELVFWVGLLPGLTEELSELNGRSMKKLLRTNNPDPRERRESCGIESWQTATSKNTHV